MENGSEREMVRRMLRGDEVAAILLLTLIWILPSEAWARQSTAANLQAALDQARARAGIIGASAAVIGPDQVWTGASGLSDRAKAIRVRPEMIFSAGSITKSFMAALTLQLAEEKKLTLNDTVGRWLPDVAANPALHIPGAVTIRQLLNHTSGIHDATDSDAFWRAFFADLGKRWTPEEILSYVETPTFEPGTSWGYSNTNYTLVGMIATRAAGASVVSELQRRFFQPLGLRSTFLEGEETVVGEIAHGHSSGFGVPKQDISSLPRTGIYSAAGTSGAIVSTSEDLARWFQALFGGGVLQPESLQQMLTFVATGNDDWEYGLGVGREQDPTVGEIWLHSGAVPGYTAKLAYLPRSRTSVALQVNEDSVSLTPLLTALLTALATAKD
jgi:D-alanyl-D-alanine carboxypeptidase